MKYYDYIKGEITKEAAIKIQSPVAKFKNMPFKNKVGAGVGVASTALAVGGSTIDAAKELTKPVDTKSIVNTGFKNGTMSVNPELNKKASSHHDSLEKSKMKYLPAVTTAATAGLIGAGVATGKLRKDVVIKEMKQVGRKASRVYDAGSKVINNASKIVKNRKNDDELKKAFDTYKAKRKDSPMEFKDFKELNGAYDNWKRKTENTTMDFESWAKKNAGRFAINQNAMNEKKAKKKIEMGVDAAIKGAALGTTTSIANFAVHEFGDEYFRKKDKDETRRVFREDWNNNFTDNLVAGKRGAKRGNSTGYMTPKQKSEYHKKKNHDSRKKRYEPKYITKSASAPAGDFANHADDIISGVNKKLKGKALFKDVIKNDVVKPAVTGLAYIGTPALIAASAKRDRNTLKKIDDTKIDRVVMDVPESVMNKKASFQDKVMKNAKKIKSDYIPDNLGQEFVRAGIRGTTFAAPVAIMANATNRNLRGNMEKLEDKNKVLKPVDEGNVRITVERRIDNE